MTLEPITPERAVELYLADRETEVTSATVTAHRYRLKHFVRWCDREEIDNLNEMSGRKLHAYRIWRRRDGDLARATEKTQMDTVRVFVRWLESIDAVEPDLSTKVRSPTLSPEDNTRDVMLDPDRAPTVLEELATYEYGSRYHVVATLLWRTMMRTGAVRALDLDDFEPDERCLHVKHRPDTGTPIKNKYDGERLIALTAGTTSLLEDWIATQRNDVTDEAGREPLVSTRHGRVAKSTIRSLTYRVTRPCRYGDCPHGRDEDTCEVFVDDHDGGCPSSVSPHAFRRGAITNALGEDVPQTVVEGRANVSGEVLEQHYDQRDQRQKMEQRRDYVNRM